MAEPTIPASLQPKTNMAGATVAQYKKIRRYGSLENYDKFVASKKLAEKEAEDKAEKIQAEVKSVGLQNASDATDYKNKYQSLSDEAKKYVATPTEYSNAVKEMQQDLIQTNTKKITQNVEKYENKLKNVINKFDEKIERYKSRDDDYKVERAKKQQRAEKEYYEGIIDALKKSKGVAAEFSNILDYATQFGQYEKEKYEYRQFKKDLTQAKEPTIKITETSPTITSYVGGKESVVSPKTTQQIYEGELKDYIPTKVTAKVPEKTGVYIPIEDISAQIKPEGVKAYTNPDRSEAFTLTPKLMKSYDTSAQVRLKAEEQQRQQGQPRLAPITTSAIDFKIDIKKNKAKEDVKQVMEFVEQSNIQLQLDERDKQIEAAKRLGIEYKEDPLTKKYYDNLISKQKSMNAPKASEIRAAGDQRSALATVLNYGREPAITGKEVIVASAASLEQDYLAIRQQEFQKDYQKFYDEKVKEIDIEKFNARIKAGESKSTVEAEYNKAVTQVNKELSEYATNWDKDWYERRGQYIEKQAKKILNDTQIIAQQKDLEAKIPQFFGRGALIGGATAAGTAGFIGGSIGVAGVIGGTAAAGVVAGAVIPAVTIVGLGVGGAYTGYQYGKAAFAGKTAGQQALALGFTKSEARIRGFAAFGQSITPYAFSAGGALTGGLVVGGTIAAATKPVVKPVTIKAPKPTIKSSGLVGKRTTINDKSAVIFPKQKIGEFTASGRRTEVTTNIRQLLNAKPIYKGVPTDQKGFVRAYGRLRQYGYSDTQTRSSLKYYAPEFKEQFLISGKTIQQNKYAKGEFKYLTRYNVVEVDKSLGIKTKAGPTQIDVQLSRTYSMPNPKGGTTFFQRTAPGKITYDSNGIRSVEYGGGKMTYGRSRQIFANEEGYVITQSVSKSRNLLTGRWQPTTRTESYIFTQSTSPTTSSVKGGKSIPKGGVQSQAQTQAQQFRVAPALAQTPTPPRTINARQTQVTYPAQVKSTFLTPLITSSLVSAAFATESLPKEKSIDAVGLFTPTSIQQTSTTLQVPKQELYSPQVIDNSGGTSGGGEIIEQPEPTPEPVGGDVFNFGITIPKRKKKKVVAIGQPVYAYNGYVMTEGKYKKVTDNPVPKSKALDVISRIVDNTISAQGKVRPTGKKIKVTQGNRGDGYYNRNKSKFRDFKILKGSRVPVKNTIIEKKNRRLDTPGETQQMTVAQFRGRQSRFRL